ncbi:MAG: hypothetical protein D6717_09415, partial [Gammaproteobacteria bacterium]
GTRHREQAGEQRQTRIQGDRRIQVQGHSRLKVHKDLHHQAAASQRLQSGEAAHLSARASLQLATTGSLRVQSEGDLTVRGKKDHILHAGGELHLQGAKEIDVTAKGPIIIEVAPGILPPATLGRPWPAQNGGGVRIEPSGEIHLYGNSITFEGAVSYAGQVNYDLGAPSLPGQAQAAVPMAARDIAGLQTDAAPDKETERPILELEYLYQDMTPVVRAPYEATFRDGRKVQGRLDDQGRARIRATSAGPVHVALGEDARDWQPNKTESPKNAYHRPALTQKDAEALVTRIDEDPKLRQMATENDPGVGAWIWGVVQGDFNENPTTSQIIVASIITMIPGIDQVADVRDIIANILTLTDEQDREDAWNWVALVVTLIGLIPIIGSALKGVFKVIINNADAGLDAILAMLRKLGKGDPLRMLKEFDWAARRQELHDLFQDAIGRLQAVLKALRESSAVRWVLDSETLEQLARWQKELDTVREAGQKKLDEAIDLLKARTEALLRRAKPKRRARIETDRPATVHTHELPVPYEPHPRALGKGPKVEGSRIHKRVHKDGDPNDPYTIMPDGKPMGAERGKMPKELAGMEELPANHDEYVKKGWPRLDVDPKGRPSEEYVNFIAAEPVRLKPGTKIYRVVDEAAYDDGGWWAFELPKNKTEWRRNYAVKDSWNDNGYYVEYEVPEGGLKVWKGPAAGQRYESVDGSDFYLPGGKDQIYLDRTSLDASKLQPKLTNWPEP